MPDWLNTGLMIISSFTGRSCLRKVSGAAFPRANVSAGVSAKSCGSWLSSPASCSSSPAVSARFPRGVTGSPELAPGTGCSPGNPLCAGAESPKSPPNRLQGLRSSRAGWSVRSWPAASATPAAGRWASKSASWSRPSPSTLLSRPGVRGPGAGPGGS